VRAQSLGTSLSSIRVEVLDGSGTTGGNVVQQKELTNIGRTIGDYTAVFNGNVPANRIRVRFINDNPNNDLKVDYIKVNNTTYQSEDASTYSIGHWNQANGCNNSGYLKVDQLYCNGYFQYNSTSGVGVGFAETGTLNEGAMAKKMQVFPNPATNKIQLSFYAAQSQQVTIIISDVAGRQVQQLRKAVGAGSNIMPLDLGLKPGTYFVKIIKDEKSEIQKLVIQ
jgi:hypothetical protein